MCGGYSFRTFCYSMVDKQSETHRNTELPTIKLLSLLVCMLILCWTCLGYTLQV